MTELGMTPQPKMVPAPWLKDGEPERWIGVGQFARLMNRSRRTIYIWLERGTLRDFGYPVFRDFTGKIFIQVTRKDLRALENMRD